MARVSGGGLGGKLNPKERFIHKVDSKIRTDAKAGAAKKAAPKAAPKPKTSTGPVVRTMKKAQARNANTQAAINATKKKGK